jgi:tetratricopeptide (TPR) repeat protein
MQEEDHEREWRFSLDMDSESEDEEPGTEEIPETEIQPDTEKKPEAEEQSLTEESAGKEESVEMERLGPDQSAGAGEEVQPETFISSDEFAGALDQIKNCQDRLGYLEERISELEKRIPSELGEIVKIDSEFDGLKNEISAASERIKEFENRIFIFEEQLRKGDEKTEAHLQVIKDEVLPPLQEMKELVDTLEAKVKEIAADTNKRIQGLRDELQYSSKRFKKRLNLYLIPLVSILVILLGFIIFGGYMVFTGRLDLASLIGTKVLSTEPDLSVEAIQKKTEEIVDRYLTGGSIEKKTGEIINKYLTEQQIEEWIKEKSSNIVGALTREIEDKGRERLVTLENLRSEYSVLLDNLIAMTKGVDLNRPLPESIRRNLGEFIEKLTDLKTEKVYSFDDWFLKGIYEYHKGDYKAAVLSWGKALALNPGSVQTYNYRGTAYRKLSEYGKAVKDISRAISMNPKSAVLYNNRGLAYSYSARYGRAIKDFNSAIELKPDYAFAYGNRGIVYMRLGWYKTAIIDFNQAVHLEPDYSYAYYLRGITFMKLNDFERAIEDFSKVLEYDKSYPDAYYNRGLSFFETGRVDEAVKDFKKTIELKPDFVLPDNIKELLTQKPAPEANQEG